MFEKRHEPLISRRRFARRMLGFFGIAAATVASAVLIGAFGYRYLGGLAWSDAFLNAALVTSGNGLKAELHTTPGKVFAIFDALLGVMVFVIVIGVLLIPVVHRVFHVFHMDIEAPKSS